MEYCDLIAHLIVDGLKNQTTSQAVNFFGIKSCLDLNEDGSFRSTNKTIKCQDNKGNRYEITVKAHQPGSAMERIESLIERHDNLKERLDRLNKRHSRNGDPLAYAVDSITTKLTFAQQDPSVLATITPEEIRGLIIEVCAQREHEYTTEDLKNVSF